MTKVIKIVYTIDNCGECFYATASTVKAGKYCYKCSKAGRRIKDIWGEIPKWCPLGDEK